MKLIKIFIVLLALSGVIALVLASRLTARPVTAMTAIQPSMNFAYVRVSGLITQYPIVDEKHETLSFRLVDESNDIRVSVYGAVLRDLLARQQVPQPGQRIDLEGTLRIRDDEASLVLNDANALHISVPEASDIALGGLDAMPIGARVSTQAQVRGIRELKGMKLVTLRDESALTTLLLPDELGPMPAVQTGAWLSITASVGEFRDSKQLLPTQAQDIQAIAQPQTSLRKISSLGKSLVGQWVTVQGRVSDLHPFKQGMRFTIVDDAANTEIESVLFDREWDRVTFSQTLSVGDTLVVRGELSEYRNNIEIHPEMAEDVWQP